MSNLALEPRADWALRAIDEHIAKWRGNVSDAVVLDSIMRFVRLGRNEPITPPLAAIPDAAIAFDGKRLLVRRFGHSVPA